MEKEKLVLYSEKLHQEAVNARAYYLILRQFSDFQYNYNNEMNMSPAFYQMVYRLMVFFLLEQNHYHQRILVSSLP